MESDHSDLTYLQEQYAKIVNDLNESIDLLAGAKNIVQQRDASVKKLTNMLNLVIENIRCAKKRMEISR